jgi:prepilin-type N-terminal cleavage/methylation domain-containing protein
MNKKGFTLIELLIFLGLFSVLMLVLTQLFTTIVETQIDTQAVSSVENDSKYIIGRLTYDLHRAQSITIPANIGDSSPSLSITIGGNPYVYNVNNGNLRLTAGGNTDTLNSPGSNVSSVSFKRVGNIGGKNAIKIDMTIEGRQVQVYGREFKTIQTTIGLR